VPVNRRDKDQLTIREDVAGGIKVCTSCVPCIVCHVLFAISPVLMAHRMPCGMMLSYVVVGTGIDLVHRQLTAIATVLIVLDHHGCDVALKLLAFHLHCLCSVHHQRNVSDRLVLASVLLCLDHCNAVRAGLSATTLVPLQNLAHSSAHCSDPLAKRPCNSYFTRGALAPVAARI